MQRQAEVCKAALAAGVRVRGYISVVLDCPYEGEVKPQAVAEVAEQLRDMGCYEISLGDTIGTGTPARSQRLIEPLARQISVELLAGHFHDTYGQALANILTVMELGVACFDSSVAGLGGCPYAKGATGNVATEDVPYMLEGLDIETGIDMSRLLDAAQFICAQLGRPTMSRAGPALAATPARAAERNT